MNLTDIFPAIEVIQNNQVVTDLRAHTYLSTYPHIIDMARDNNPNTNQQFHQIALLVYGWMPRVLRINPIHSQSASLAMVAARNATIENYKNVNIQHVADSLHSLVGASKLLHFINPEVFPIWDSKIQAFLGRSNSHSAMGRMSYYHQYADEVHSISRDPGFTEFYNCYLMANTQRLVSSNINPYQVSEIRAIEASAFELAS